MTVRHAAMALEKCVVSVNESESDVEWDRKDV